MGGHLAADDIARFDRDGFVHLPGRIQADLLHNLRSAAARLCQDVEREWRDTGKAPDAYCMTRAEGPAAYRVDNMMGREGLADPLPFWALLGSPAVTGAATSLCGDDAVPTQVDLVVKRASHGEAIGWHQDNLHLSDARYLAMGLYLDDVRPGDGGLLVVPGTHRAAQDICALEQAHGWDLPGAVEVAAEAGDMVIHHVMALHASAALRHTRERRTLYVYWRSAADMLRASPDRAAWVEAQAMWLSQAREAWAAWESGSGDAANLAPLPNPHPRPALGSGGNYCIRQGGKVLGTSWKLNRPHAA